MYKGRTEKYWAMVGRMNKTELKAWKANELKQINKHAKSQAKKAGKR